MHRYNSLYGLATRKERVLFPETFKTCKDDANDDVDFILDKYKDLDYTTFKKIFLNHTTGLTVEHGMP